MTCAVTCVCRCQQQGCGCNEGVSPRKPTYRPASGPPCSICTSPMESQNVRTDAGLVVVVVHCSTCDGRLS